MEHAIRAAGAISEDTELYIVGSQSILGTVPEAGGLLVRSMEIDIAPKNYPEREALIEGSIGELSPFHATFGFWVDGVDLAAIVLPDDWQSRLVVVDNPNTNGYRGLCLELRDLAVSKLAAGRKKDREYVAALLSGGLITGVDLLDRIGETRSLDPVARERLRTVATSLIGG